MPAGVGVGLAGEGALGHVRAWYTLPPVCSSVSPVPDRKWHAKGAGSCLSGVGGWDTPLEGGRSCKTPRHAFPKPDLHSIQPSQWSRSSLAANRLPGDLQMSLTCLCPLGLLSRELPSETPLPLLPGWQVGFMAAEGREGFGQGGTHGTASGAAERCWGRQMHVGFSVMGKRCGACTGYTLVALLPSSTRYPACWYLGTRQGLAAPGWSVGGGRKSKHTRGQEPRRSQTRRFGSGPGTFAASHFQHPSCLPANTVPAVPDPHGFLTVYAYPQVHKRPPPHRGGVPPGLAVQHGSHEAAQEGRQPGGLPVRLRGGWGMQE